MVETEDDTLIHFYNILSTNTKNKLKFKGNSVFITLIEDTSNNVLEVLQESAIPFHLIPNDSLKSLDDAKLIKTSDEGQSYQITARGIWTVEKNKGMINELTLIDYFENKKFSVVFEKNSDMDYREKVIILSMIAMRTFSKDSCINLQLKDGLHDEWKKIIDEVAETLLKFDIITEKEIKSLYGRAANDPPVTSILRRLPDMKKHTQFIFQTDNALHYWLEMPESTDGLKEKLAWLFYSIFKEKLSFDSLEAISSFCCNLAHNMSIYVFDLETHIYNTPNYDNLIKDALIMGIREYS